MNAYQPNVVEIEMSHLCNLRCPGCAIINDIKTAKYKLTDETILDVLKQAKREGINYYGLTGGEPFVNLDILKSIIEKAPLDLIKINTNGYIFSSTEKAKKIIKELKDHGFGIRNKKIKAYLNVSVGQQTIQGIPLENAVYALMAITEVYENNEVGFALKVFYPDLEFENYIVEKFLRIYKKITKKDFDHSQHLIKLTTADIRECSTALITGYSDNQTDTIKNLINYYWDLVSLNCNFQEEKGTVKGQRLFIRANGDVFTCSGFSHVFLLGNIYKETIKNMLQKANKDLAIKAVFNGGLKKILKLAEVYNPQIGNQKLSISYGPCDICRILKNQIESKY